MFELFVLMVFAAICAIAWVVVAIMLGFKPIVKALAVVSAVLCIVISVILFMTPQTQMYWIKFKVGAQKGTWIVIDNSGGETMRHWVLYNNYVKGCDQTDGWEFFAETCSPCYVGGDSFVGKITEDQIKGDKYKKQFNIPEDQEALH